MKKLLFIIPLLISAVSLNAADRPLRERGKEPGMILDLQKISLGTISSVEEKKQYLSTVQLEKQRIQNYTLKMVYENAYDLYKRGDYQRAHELANVILSIDPSLTKAQTLSKEAGRMATYGTLSEAEIINMKHDWKQPDEIRDMRKADIAESCEYILQRMEECDVDKYFRLLQMKGYDVKPRYDKNRNLVGYTIGKNASVFKASDIGRRYMASQLEATWKKLHPKPIQVRMKPVSPIVPSSNSLSRPFIPKPTIAKTKVHSNPVPINTVFNINTENDVKKVWIPNTVKDIFLNEVQIPEENEIATIENVSHVAMLLFVGYIDAATSMSESCGGGGGSAPESDWGKKDDEDERAFARRCLHMAHSMCKPKHVRRSYHR